MSNELAISAVTLALRKFLHDGMIVLPPVFDQSPAPFFPIPISKRLEITMLPLHKVRENLPDVNVVNLSLFRIDFNPGWRNQALASQTRPGESGPPPLALNLEYLVTAYGEDDHEDVAHFLLGQAMRIFHDHAVVPRNRLKSALEIAHVQDQIENIRVTPRSLSADELSKIWTVAQTQHRLAAAYLVNVILIDSRAPVRSALPVLTRGKDDRGVDALASPPPSLDSVTPASGFNAAVIGEDLLVNGERLDANGVVARVSHPLMPRPVDLPVSFVNALQLRVTIPPLPPFDPPETGSAAAWPAGIYSLSLVVTRPNGPGWTTSDVPFALAPAITVSPAVHLPPPAKFEVTITATPQVRDGQATIVIWDGTQLAPKLVTTAPPNDPTATTTVTFDIEPADGVHRVRLRLGGIDSLVMKRTNGVLTFDDAQSVKVGP
jgi:Pvc16 N-terminal domain